MKPSRRMFSVFPSIELLGTPPQSMRHSFAVREAGSPYFCLFPPANIIEYPKLLDSSPMHSWIGDRHQFLLFDVDIRVSPDIVGQQHMCLV